MCLCPDDDPKQAQDFTHPKSFYPWNHGGGVLGVAALHFGKNESSSEKNPSSKSFGK